MVPRAILVSACLCALAIALPTTSFGSHIYFDAAADLVADTELTVGVGETLVVSVCLSDFTDTTGSFQFDVLYDGAVLTLLDYDTYMSQPDEDPGLTGTIQTLAELGPWATSQWTDPVTQETNAYDSGAGLMREFYRSTGMPLSDGVEEAMRRMESGEDPESIESEMGDLLDAEEGLPNGRKSAGLRALRKRLLPPDVDGTLYEL